MNEVDALISAPVTIAGVEFLPVISFGHLIGLAITIVGGLIAIGKLIATVRNTRIDVNNLRTEVVELRKDIGGLMRALIAYKVSGPIKMAGDQYTPKDNEDD